MDLKTVLFTIDMGLNWKGVENPDVGFTISNLIGLVGILVALVLFLLLVYKGWSSYVIAPVCGLIVMVTNLGDIPDITTFVNYFLLGKGTVMGITGVLASLFTIIFLGAIFGKVFTDTGAASAIAKTLTNRFIIKSTGPKQVWVALLCMLVMAGLCTMGGIDGFVLMFTMFPICMIIAEIVNIPRRFVPGMLCLNVAFITAPGSPQIYNVMGLQAAKSMQSNPKLTAEAAETLKNMDSTVGLIPGLAACLVIAVLSYIILSKMIIKAQKNGEVFDYGPLPKFEAEERKTPPFIVAILPLITVFVLYALFPSILGIQVNVAVALAAGIVLNIALMFPYIQKKGQHGQPVSLSHAIMTSIGNGANNYPNALLTVVTPTGLAAIVGVTAVFGILTSALGALPIDPIVLTIFIIVIIVALTSSPPATLMLAMPIIIGILIATTSAVSPAAVTRVAIIAASTFETLPVNGMIIVAIGLARSTHKESYKPMFYMSVAVTFLGTLVAAGLFLLFPTLR